MCKQPFLVLFVLLGSISPAFAEGVIGSDQVLTVNTVQFLAATTENAAYVQAFNYFFTIELLTGVLGAFIYQVIKVFRM
ncbi:MAG: hypothetical protein PHI97_19395 [Desulfobulbus sp.]|nr:hypothetical protein [Desulfobulbus sp.]